VLPCATGLAAALAVLGVLGPGAAAASVPAGDWWLTGPQVPQAWGQSEGAGVTVAVLGTGVDTRDPGLGGTVVTGPDFTRAAGSTRRPGGPYWGTEGTTVASYAAGRQDGPGPAGVAPAARILSVRVTLEFNDPLAADPAVSGRLPAAIAQGIRYAADHGARVIDLPLDPGTLGLSSAGDPAAAGGSPAERDAVSYALSKGAILVAPAGDDGQGPALVNYPAAYPGVIAVGATDRAGGLAPFSSTRSRASLTAPGAGLPAAVSTSARRTISSTSTASGIVAGVAALILSRFPQLSATQVTRAMTGSAGGPAQAGVTRPAAGTGRGPVNAARALAEAAAISAAERPSPAATPSASVSASGSSPSASAPAAAARPSRAPGTVAGDVLRLALIGVGVVIVALLAALLVLRFRRERADAAAPGRRRAGGQHQQPGGGPRGDSEASRPRGPGRDAARRGRAAGPPWGPAPEPRRETGPQPAWPGPGREPGVRPGPGGMTAPARAEPGLAQPGLAQPGTGFATVPVPPGVSARPPGSPARAPWDDEAAGPSSSWDPAARNFAAGEPPGDG
jgi:hypothetical protein